MFSYGSPKWAPTVAPFFMSHTCYNESTVKLDELKKYKEILILGYGLEGKATERFLKKFHPDAEIGIADQKDGPDYLDKQKDYDLAIRTPLLRPKFLTIPYTTATNLFFANITNPIIGVTGTKGKSTTVSLLDSILKAAHIKSVLCGNIGVPMLDIFVKGIRPNDVFVLELSSYQLEDLQYSPDIACFLNIYEETHNHDDFDEYFEAKSRITQQQKHDDVYFYNGQSEIIAQLAEETCAQAQDFSTIDVESLLKEVDMDFYTHMDNIKACWAIASYLGADEQALVKGIERYKPLPHRLHKVGEYNGVTFYDDSNSFNPISTMFALDTLDYVDFLILGGEDRQTTYQELVAKMADKHVSHVILFPDTQEKIYNEISAHEGYDPQILQADSMDEALSYVFKMSVGDEICLLSPAAPSFSMYANAHERAEDYIRTIKHYAAKKKNTKKTSKKGIKAKTKKA